jgi:protein SCO1
VNKKSLVSSSLILLIVSITLFAISNGNANIGNTGIANNQVPFYNSAELTPVWYDSHSNENPPSSQFPEFSLVDQSGIKISRSDLKEKLVVANFFFTYCTNICPTLTSSMSRVRDAFNGRNDVMFLSHSVTPEFDIVPMLHAYAIANKIDGKQWRLLTGTNSELSKVAHEGYFVPKTAVSKNGFIHTELFVLLDGKQRVRGVYNGTLQIEIDLLVSDIKQLLKESPEPNWINKLFN